MGQIRLSSTWFPKQWARNCFLRTGQQATCGMCYHVEFGGEGGRAAVSIAPRCRLVYCGPPSQPNWDFSACTDHGNGGTCSPSCATGYTGNPRAVCEQTGGWKYSGSCSIGVSQSMPTQCTPAPHSTALPHTTLGWRPRRMPPLCTIQCSVGLSEI